MSNRQSEVEFIRAQLQAAQESINSIAEETEKVERLSERSREDLEKMRSNRVALDMQIQNLRFNTRETRRKMDKLIAINTKILEATMPTKVVEVLVIIAIFSSGLFLASNLAAMKLLNLGNFPVDGGIFLFPFTYILDDLLKEIYGKEITRKMILANFTLCIMVLGILQLVKFIPAAMFATENAGFNLMMGSMGRIFFASIIAALISRLVDNFIFDHHLQKNPDAPEWIRALQSSTASRAFDMVIFDLVAFFGHIPLASLIRQLLLAYVLATVLEMLFLPVENFLSNLLAQKLHYRHGKTQ